MPPQEERRRAKYMYFPTELVEEVVLKLPVKSLSRFSTVSKSWNSTIQSRDFAKRYRGREMIVLKPNSDPGTALVYPLSSIPSGNPTADLPLPGAISRVRVSCGELWCVELEDGSVCLYNPSMRICRKLPASPTPINISAWASLSYGVGYDSSTDDYKVLKLSSHSSGMVSELYSQRSDSWRKLGDSIACMALPSHGHGDDIFPFFVLYRGSVFVNGLLHWIGGHAERISSTCVFTIASFDLSTEKYGMVAMPEPLARVPDLGVLRGKLSVYSENIEQRRGVVWVHDGGLWSKEMVFNFSHIFPNIDINSYSCLALLTVRPLRSYNSNSNVKAFVATTNDCIANIFLYEDDSRLLVEKDFGCGILDRCFTYVESMVKP